MKKTTILIAAFTVVLLLLALNSLSSTVQAQPPDTTPEATEVPGGPPDTGAEPTPTLIVLVVSRQFEPSPWYYFMKGKIDDLYGELDESFSFWEAKAEELEDLTDTMIELWIEGEIDIGDETLTIEDMTSEFVEGLTGVFLFRCYLSTPLSRWTLIFLAWMILVMLIKTLISMMPFLMRIFEFIINMFWKIYEVIRDIIQTIASML